MTAFCLRTNSHNPYLKKTKNSPIFSSVSFKSFQILPNLFQILPNKSLFFRPKAVKIVPRVAL